MNESGVENVCAKLEDHLVEEDGLKQVELSAVEDTLMRTLEDFAVPGSCPQKLSYWIRRYASSVASSLLG